MIGPLTRRQAMDQAWEEWNRAGRLIATIVIRDGNADFLDREIGRKTVATFQANKKLWEDLMERWEAEYAERSR